MRASDVTCIMVMAASSCGTPSEPEPEASTSAAEASTSAAEASTSAAEASTSAAEASTSAAEASTGATEASTGADETTAGLGQERPEVAGRWACSGFEDPIWLDIAVYRVDPPSIEGWGHGVTLPPDFEDPFSSMNFGELAVNPALPPIQFQFELPYPDFPDFGPLGVEFIGSYEPPTDRLVGVLWISTLNDTVMAECERFES